MRRSYRTARFLKGLTIYSLLVVMLGAAALCLLYFYLQAYESSRPSAAVRAYIAEAEKGNLSYDWGRCLAKLDRRFQSEEELRAWVGEKLSGASIRELRSDETGQKRFALLDSEGICFEELTLRRGEKGRWGFTDWEVCEETCSVEAYEHSFSLRVPASYTVILGDQTLEAEQYARKGVSYELLAPFANYVPELPMLVEYEVGPYLGEQPARVLDEKGEELAAEDLNEFRYLSGTCTKAEEKRVRDFLIDYLNVYLPYAGDLNRYGIAYWDQLYAMIVHNGELEERLVQARQDFGFGNTNAIELLSDEVRLCTKIRSGGSDVYVVDFGFRIETVGLHGPVEEDNQIRFLIVEEDGQLLVQTMYSY